MRNGRLPATFPPPPTTGGVGLPSGCTCRTKNRPPAPPTFEVALGGDLVATVFSGDLAAVVDFEAAAAASFGGDFAGEEDLDGVDGGAVTLAMLK